MPLQGNPNGRASRGSSNRAGGLMVYVNRSRAAAMTTRLRLVTAGGPRKAEDASSPSGRTALRQPPLKPCALLGRLGQATDDLAPRKADVAQLAIGEGPQNGQIGLMFALRDDGRNEVVDGPNKTAPKAPC